MGGLHACRPREEDVVTPAENPAGTPATGAQAAQHTPTPAPATSTYVDFLCYRIDPAFRRLPLAERAMAATEFARVLREEAPGLEVRPHLTMGFRADCDFFLWCIAKDLQLFQGFAAAVLRTRLGSWLHLTYAWIAVTKPSVYSRAHRQHFEVAPETSKYCFIYPFTKTHAWYQLPIDKRSEMMSSHNELGHQFPGVLINTCYQFGLGDHDFMLAFEADDPRVFSDLVQRLRETASRVYTTTDIPLMPGTRQTPEELIESLALA